MIALQLPFLASVLRIFPMEAWLQSSLILVFKEHL